MVILGTPCTPRLVNAQCFTETVSVLLSPSLFRNALSGGKKMSSRQSALHSPAVIVHIENMRDRGKTRRGLISAVACEVIAVYMYSGAETDVEKGGGSGVTP